MVQEEERRHGVRDLGRSRTLRCIADVGMLCARSGANALVVKG